MTRVWKDERGLFVRVGGYVARPGKVSGYHYANEMGEGGLVEGDKVPTLVIQSGSPFVRLTTLFGPILWATTDEMGYRRTK
jgi:hypothetical protein